MLNGPKTESPRATEQPLGEPLTAWTAAPRPQSTTMVGRYCHLVSLKAEAHAAALYHQYAVQVDGRDWTYLPYGPFDSTDSYGSWIRSLQGDDDPMLFAVVEIVSQRPLGVSAYLRIQPAIGSIEVGHVSYSPALQRTVAATEAMYLMMQRAFDELGYRRYEWKCDALNEPSKRAAERLGFQYEGAFRQATIVKGRNRDTAWFSLLDGDWPRLRAAFDSYLAPENFDAKGRQKRALGKFR